MRLAVLLAVIVLSATACRRTGEAASVAKDADSQLGLAKRTVVKLGPESADQAIAIANRYLADKRPALDVSQKPPSAEYFAENRSTMAAGGPFWLVSYAVPASRDSAGKIVGVRPHIGYGVYLNLAGEVVNEISHSP